MWDEILGISMGTIYAPLIAHLCLNSNESKYKVQLHKTLLNMIKIDKLNNTNRYLDGISAVYNQDFSK